MSKKASPTLIGTFVLGAIILGVSLVIIFGTFKFFAKNEQFVLYFDESINGLSIGAPIKFRGVPIGTVKKIMIHFNQSDNSPHIPIIAEINTSRLMNELGLKHDLSDDEVFKQVVNSGLRAHLETESFITGLYYIEMDDLLNAPRPVLIQQQPAIYKEIPTVPSALVEIRASATDTLASIGKIDFRTLSSQLVKLLRQVNDGIGELQFAQINDSLVDTLGALKAKAESEEIDKAITTTTKTLEQIQMTINHIDGKIDPFFGQVEDTNQELKTTLTAVKEVTEQLNHLFSPESSMRYELENALNNLGKAAQAVQMLTEYLERNPKALITGKPKHQTRP